MKAVVSQESERPEARAAQANGPSRRRLRGLGCRQFGVTGKGDLMIPFWLEQALGYVAVILGFGFLINLNNLVRTMTRYYELRISKGEK
jgi:hypothetical protein